MDEKNNLEQLSKIVDPEVIEIVSLVRYLQKAIVTELQSECILRSVLHVRFFIEKQSDEKKIPNDKITEIIQNYPDEYALTCNFRQIYIRNFDSTFDGESC